MLKRIKIIREVGVFKNFTKGNDKEFGKLTFIYGLNTYGKSTLCDILKSLSTSNNELITKRKSKPTNDNMQEVILSVDDIDRKTEGSIKFENNNWINNNVGKNIKVFDTSFIYDNLFDGIYLLENRETKENFSDFILGSEGVKLGKELETKNAELRAKKKELKNSIPDHLKKDNSKAIDEKTIKDFIELRVDEKFEDLKEIIESLTEKKRILSKDIQNKDKILSLPEPKKIPLQKFITLKTAINSANALLETSFDKLSEGAVAKLRDHIKKHLSNSNEAENWIKKGLFYASTENCPFCGQSLEKAQDLIQTYQSFFNKEYIDFLTSVEGNIDGYVRSISINLDSEKAINEALLSLKDYSEKIEAEEFKTAISSINELKTKVLPVEESIRKTVLSMKEDFEVCAKNKKQKPYCKIEVINTNTLFEMIKQYEENTEAINNKIDLLLVHIATYKDKYKNNKAITEIETLDNKIKAYEKKKDRLEHNDDCVEYLKISKTISELSLEVDKLSKEINENQSAFLDKYFTAIDGLFRELGSNKYKIEKGKPSDRGDKKVYGISIKFNNEQIPLKDLPFTFSDSDRRALALSIFWAKIKTLNDDEMGKQIIVLDDPVTSFDDNRILKNNDMIWSIKDKVDQIILLTHYNSFVKNFYLRCKQGDGSVFLCLEQDHLTSSIVKMDIETFCCSDMEQKFICISDYINQKSELDVRNMLRLYYENHLRYLFYKYFYENNLLKKTLEVKIDKLREDDLISEPVKERLHRFRHYLNTETHIFTTNNEADIRSFADDLMKYIHNIEIKELN